MEENRHHQFFQNRECKYFPCHKGIDEEEFNCLFCYCPLYALGKKCGGNCRYNEKGNKVCTDCTFPHHKDNYSKVISRYPDIMLTVRRNDQEDIWTQKSRRNGSGIMLRNRFIRWDCWKI